MENPLLIEAGLPPFSHIEVSHAEPAIDTVIAENRAALASLLENVATPDPYSTSLIQAVPPTPWGLAA
ncbi:MAG: hypothetical protein ACREU8_11360 [Gammaproteobacteria bacterium]